METTPTGLVETTVSTPPQQQRRGLSVELLLYLLILVLAIVTRYAFLDAMALHHDEGIHAFYGWSIYTGRGWIHDAVYHGPLIYHMEALGFALFGDSDGTTRVMLALFSVITVMAPALLRRQLGRWGALIASFLFLISPSFLYFGRFGHPDVFGSALTLLLFICAVRYLAEPPDAKYRNLWLYGAVLAASLHFSAKPTAYITTGIFLLFLAGRVLWERYGVRIFWLLLALLPAGAEDLWKAIAKENFSLNQYKVGPLSLSVFSLAPLALAALVIAGLLLWRWWEAAEKKQKDSSLDLLMVLGTMVVPLLSAIPLNLLVKLRHLPALDYHTPDISQEVVFLGLIAIVGCFAVAAALGLRWDARRWGISAAIFWSVFFILHTSFFSSMTGWITGLVQALGFWMTQQDVKRIHVGPQYYVMLMSAYETVALIFGSIAVFFFAWRGLAAPPRKERPPQDVEPAPPGPPPLGATPGVATGMLAFWAPLALGIFSMAGEQVPWLNVHPTLPFILLAGALLGRIVSYRPRTVRPAELRLWADRGLLVLAAALLLWAGRPAFQQGGPQMFTWIVSAILLVALSALAFSSSNRWGEAAFVTLAVAVGVMTIVQASAISYTQSFADWRPVLYVPLLLVLLALILRVALLGKVALRSAALVVFAFLCVYGAGSAFRLTYINNDTPVEMMVYVQTSSDLQWVVDEVATLSKLTTGGNDIVIMYDDQVAWPLEWYLRNYPHKSYQATVAGPPPDDAAVAIVYRDKDNTSGPYLENRFYPYRYYAFNWWFPEDGFRQARNMADLLDPEELKGQDLSNFQLVAKTFASAQGQARSWRYMLFREPLAPLGAREFALYVRKDLVSQLVLLQGSIPRR